MNNASLPFEETEMQNTHQNNEIEKSNNTNEENFKNGIQKDNNELTVNQPQLNLIGDAKYSNRGKHKNQPQVSNQESALNRLFTFGSYLISPIDELRGKESAFSPLKNESLFLLSSSNKRDMQSSFESIVNVFDITYPVECDFSLSKKEEGLLQGTCLNFNNIDISPEASENEDVFANMRHHPEDNHILLNRNTVVLGKIQCTCTKTNCRKKYCACYANGKYCDNCQCKNCDNKGMNSKSSRNKLTISIICNCTKSNCTKKYCECFKNGIECSPLCRCLNCTNSSSCALNVNQQVVNVMEVSPQSLMYSIEEIRIEIRNNVMSVKQKGSHCSHNISAVKEKHPHTLSSNKRNFSHPVMNEAYTPMKVIGKKKTRGKAESSTNVKTPWLLSSNKNTRSSQRMLSNKKKLDL